MKITELLPLEVYPLAFVPISFNRLASRKTELINFISNDTAKIVARAAFSADSDHIAP